MGIEPIDGAQEQPGRSDMLFTDGLVDLDNEVGYRGPEAQRVAGITYRQLDYWDRTGLVSPSIRAAGGSGTQRRYGYQDILALRIVKNLLDAGVSLQQVRKAIDQLRRIGLDALAQMTLMSDGASVYLCTSDDEVIDLVHRGQGVFGISVGRVLREVETSLVELGTVEQPVDELARRRAQRAAS